MAGSVGIGRRRQGIVQKQPRAAPRESIPPPGSRESKQDVVARVGPGGDSRSKRPFSQAANNPPELAPGPAVDPVFAAEGRPGCDKGHKFDPRGESGDERRRVRLGEQSHLRLSRCSAKKGHREGEVAKAP